MNDFATERAAEAIDRAAIELMSTMLAYLSNHPRHREMLAKVASIRDEAIRGVRDIADGTV